jgi:DNA-binding NtrC family response regulator
MIHLLNKDNSIKMPKKILVVEDNRELSTIIENLLRRAFRDPQIDWVERADYAWDLYGSRHEIFGPSQLWGIDFCLFDIYTDGDINGLQLTDMIKRIRPSLPVAVMSYLSAEEYKSLAQQHTYQSNHFIEKPFYPEKIIETFKKLA